LEVFVPVEVLVPVPVGVEVPVLPPVAVIEPVVEPVLVSVSVSVGVLMQSFNAEQACSVDPAPQPKAVMRTQIPRTLERAFMFVFVIFLPSFQGGFSYIVKGRVTGTTPVPAFFSILNIYHNNGFVKPPPSFFGLFKVKKSS
jgi:hypothetical protein